jgi:leucyl-tRNA synthetase
VHGRLEKAHVDPGIMVQSGPFTGQRSDEGLKKVVGFLSDKGVGGARVHYKLRDWLISRQRYWGAPIPVVYCDACGMVPVPEDHLPVLLPEKVDFKGEGESPLTTNPEWMHTPCPRCGAQARREADTMDTFVCSSWYYLRFPNPRYDKAPFDPDAVKRWLPVDQYVGGAEHAVMHLLYARFFTKVLHDLGLVGFDEPFSRLIHQGVITNQGAKMSKSRGNVINPDPYIEEYGSDVFRLYLMFMGAYTDGGDWSDEGIQSMFKFLNRVYRLIETVRQKPPAGSETIRSAELERIRHATVKMATQDLERFQFHGAISRIMELVNTLYLYIQDVPVRDQNRQALEASLNTVVQLVAPFAPHFGEELWRQLGHHDSVFLSVWPSWDERVLRTDTVQMVVQINGKVRGQIDAARDAGEAALKTLVAENEKFKKYLEGREIVKFVVVKNKLVSIAVRE